MGGAAKNERAVLRVPVVAPWLLGTAVECLIDGEAVILQDASTGAVVRLAPSDLVRQMGRRLDFCSRAAPIGGHCVEFAGLGRDARYDVFFSDEATAAKVAARIRNQFANRSE